MIDLRLTIAAFAAFALAGCATTGATARSEPELLGGPSAVGGSPNGGPAAPSGQFNETFTEEEVVRAVSGFLGTTAEAAAAAVERIFRENGRPNAYITGEEVSGALGVGLRYGQGTLVMKAGPRRQVHWQGPSVGFDTGANASKVFTLVYDIRGPDDIYRRFPGVEGTAYFVGGLGVNYQRADGITLAPIRAGVGFRAGANVGYLAYSREQRVNPF